jgi:hypothetical protein
MFSKQDNFTLFRVFFIQVIMSTRLILAHADVVGCQRQVALDD